MKYFFERITEDGLLYVIFIFILPTLLIFNLVIFFLKAKINKKSIRAAIIALLWPTPLLFIAIHFFNKNLGEDKGLGGLPDFFAEIFFLAAYLVALTISIVRLRFFVLKRIQQQKLHRR